MSYKLVLMLNCDAHSVHCVEVPQSIAAEDTHAESDVTGSFIGRCMYGAHVEDVT